MKHHHDAVIVGGGHNGLVCAAYLAKAGLDVLILEQRPQVGGAVVTDELFPGFRFSTFSYIVYVLQDKVVADLDLYKHGYKVQHLPHKRFFPFPDGQSLIFWRDNNRTIAEVERKFGPKDAEGYRKWQAFWQIGGAIINEYFLKEPPTIDELVAQVKGTEREPVLDRMLNDTLMNFLDDLYVSDEMKAASIAHVVDMNGLDKPGAIFGYAATKPSAHVNGANQGIALGGMGTLSGAMARAAQSFGAKIRTEAMVNRILIDNDRAVGVELANGETIYSKLVISNADPKQTFLKLVGTDFLQPDVTDTINTLETGCTTLKFHAAVNQRPDFSRFLDADTDPRIIAETSICPSTDFFSQSLASAKAGQPLTHPIVDAQIPSVYDDSLAPDGKHVVSMWVRFVPYKPNGTTWDDIREQVGNQLIDYLTEFAPNFRASIEDWMLFTPVDFERWLCMTDGNFRHTDHNVNQLMGGRLFNNGGHRTPIDGLYMCGAGTHPGGDVSGAPGHNAAHAIIADLNLSH